MLLLVFSLVCPCCASLHLPQAALGSALTEEKKAAKNQLFLRIQQKVVEGAPAAALAADVDAHGEGT